MRRFWPALMTGAALAVTSQVDAADPSRIAHRPSSATEAGETVETWARAPVLESGAPDLFTLTCQNGLTAVVDSRPSSRTVFIQVAVRVGSRDEPPGLGGISHLLEHLLFKEGHGQGGRRNPAFSALRAAGGLVNASTDFELTEYHADPSVFG